MKLRNKKTGEIIETCEIFENLYGKIRIRKDAIKAYAYEYDSLAELCEEWEDYKEPKVGYIIDPMEEDYVAADDSSGYEELNIERAKELGIWFEAKEEAEKAVEKLKAFKRLRDKGFRFVLSATTMDRIDIVRECFDSIEQAAEARDDIITLFGGEE